MNMKKLPGWSTVILIMIFLSSCTSQVQHLDEFYNDEGIYPYARFPLIKPYHVDRKDGNSPWLMSLRKLWAPPDYLYFYNVEDVRKLSVMGNVIMAYSPYIDEQANQSIQENYYHWFVIVPDKGTEAGFHDESAFLDYIHQLGIQQPDWQEPLDIFKEFERTGCLEWIPDCN